MKQRGTRPRCRAQPNHTSRRQFDFEPVVYRFSKLVLELLAKGRLGPLLRSPVLPTYSKGVFI